MVRDRGEVIAYLLGVGGRGLVGGGPGHGGIPADEGAGPLKLYPKELNEVGSLGFNSVCAGAGIAKACIYVVQLEVIGNGAIAADSID